MLRIDQIVERLNVKKETEKSALFIKGPMVTISMKLYNAFYITNAIKSRCPYMCRKQNRLDRV